MGGKWDKTSEGINEKQYFIHQKTVVAKTTCFRSRPGVYQACQIKQVIFFF